MVVIDVPDYTLAKVLLAIATMAFFIFMAAYSKKRSQFPTIILGAALTTIILVIGERLWNVTFQPVIDMYHGTPASLFAAGATIAMVGMVWFVGVILRNHVVTVHSDEGIQAWQGKKKMLHWPWISVVLIVCLVALPYAVVYTPVQELTVAEAENHGLLEVVSPDDGTGYHYIYGMDGCSHNLQIQTSTGWKNVYDNVTILDGNVFIPVDLAGNTPLPAASYYTHLIALDNTAEDLWEAGVRGFRLDFPVYTEELESVGIFFMDDATPDYDVWFIYSNINQDDYSAVYYRPSELEYIAETHPDYHAVVYMTIDRSPVQDDNLTCYMAFYGDNGTYDGEFGGWFENPDAKGVYLGAVGLFLIYCGLLATEYFDVDLRRKKKEKAS